MKGGARLIPLLLAAVALSPNPRAALPGLTYYFRDFGLTFYPQRELFVRELLEGRWPFWNGLAYEGSAFLPILYPPELLQALWPGPAFASWLLTLHLPLAALGMYVLALDLGACRRGAFVAGALFSLGGLSLSALNLYIFLEALALTPFIVLTLRRAARDGGRWIAGAALAIGLAVSTLAVEFAAQAVLLGLCLAAFERPAPRAALRAGAGVALGAGLAALPILLVASIAAEGVRGSGLPAGEALQKSLHPLMLLQFVLPDVFVSASQPVRFGWPSRLIPDGSPYFVSLYLGPVALALAFSGLKQLRRGPRLLLLSAGFLGLVWALGRHAGLATLLVPYVRFFRYPVKALLLPHAVVALFAGLGVTRFGQGEGTRGFLLAIAGIGAISAGALAVAAASGMPVALWLGFTPAAMADCRARLAVEAPFALALTIAAGALAAGVRRGRVPASRAAMLLAIVAVLDVWRAGVGLNRQTSLRFFEPLPEIAGHLSGLGGGRVFSYGVRNSPAMFRLLSSREPGLEIRAFFLSRQVMTPLFNLLDGVELAEGPDLHGFIPNPPVLKPTDYDPLVVGRILPVLRNAAVSRIVSLDPLDHPELRLLGAVPTGLPEFLIHVYQIEDPWPRVYVACGVRTAPDRTSAFLMAISEGFDPKRDVALQESKPVSCREAVVERRATPPNQQAYSVRSDGDGYLVMRDSYTPSWRATVDGHPVAVVPANGRHRAVRISAGQHEVRLCYEAPGLTPGLALSAVSVLLVLGLAVRPPARSRAALGRRPASGV